MRKVQLLLLLIIPGIISAQSFTQQFVATDIDNFYEAYDKIRSTSDSTEQVNYLQELYLNKATPGLTSLMAVRNYSAQEIVGHINNSPSFWNSVRADLLAAEKVYNEIESDILKLKEAYRNFMPAVIYFSVGAFRSNGTIDGYKVLISAETALASNTADISDLPEWRKPFFKNSDHRKNIALLCTHEYVHTQQKPIVHNLLSECLWEGIAEFISCKVTGKQSTTPAIEFGKANEKEVVSQFVKDLFLMTNNNNWLWAENRNQFKVRDLGYYIGYEIAERYYNASENKEQAIKELIELDYTNVDEVERIINSTRLLPKSVSQLNDEYENARPFVLKVSPDSKKIKSGITRFTITFSEPLNGISFGIDFGPLGPDHFPKIDPNRVWSADKRSITLTLNLKPGVHYQFLVDNTFRLENGIRLKPFLVDFTTLNK